MKLNKVLSTAMVLAMLAPTASAFASTAASVGQNQTIGGADTNTHQAEMTMTGQVRNQDGSAAAGRIEISLPTSISFVVDQDGNVQTPTSIPVTNQSQVEVEVSLVNFTDSTPTDGEGITLVADANALSQKGRNFVNLVLEGNKGTPTALLHNSTTSGPMLELGAANSGTNTANLILTGVAGDKVNDGSASSGTNDTFTARFQVAKKQVTQQP